MHVVGVRATVSVCIRRVCECVRVCICGHVCARYEGSTVVGVVNGASFAAAASAASAASSDATAYTRKQYIHTHTHKNAQCCAIEPTRP